VGAQHGHPRATSRGVATCYWVATPNILKPYAGSFHGAAPAESAFRPRYRNPEVRAEDTIAARPAVLVGRICHKARQSLLYSKELQAADLRK